MRSLKALLDRLDDESIEVDGLTVHTPDLDDVFFALTGHPGTARISTPTEHAGASKEAVR